MREQQIQGYVSGIRDEFILEAQPRALAALTADGTSDSAVLLGSPAQKSKARSKKRWIPAMIAAAIAVTVGLNLGLYSGITAIMGTGGGIFPSSSPSAPSGSPFGDLFGSLFPFLSPETEPPFEVTIRDPDDVTEPPPPPDTRTECQKGNHEWAFTDSGDATCYRVGSVIYTCAVCEETKTESEKIAHIHNDGFCTVCGMAEGAWEDVNMEAHRTDEGAYYAVILRVNGEPSGKLTLPNVCYFPDFDVMAPVTEIREHALSQKTNVTEAVIPETVTIIQKFAFSGCSALEWVRFPYGLTSVGDYSFTECENLRTAHLPNTVVELGEGVFEGCRALESATFPAGVEDIPPRFFNRCEKLCLVHYDGDIRTIGYSAFSGCQALPETPPLHKVSAIGSNAFDACYSLTEVTLPVTLRKLEYGVFQSCIGLKKVTMQAPSLLAVSGRVFARCTSLKEINLPKIAGSFSGQDMFADCGGLTVYFSGTREEWQKNYGLRWLDLPINTKVIFMEEETAE